MKRSLILLLLVGLYSCCGRPSERTDLEGQPIPNFRLLLADSTTYFNTAGIPFGKPVILFYFDPYCPYCRDQMAEIIKGAPILKDARFYIFSTSPFNEIQTFAAHYQLKKYPNMVVGMDCSAFFARYFGVSGVPYMAIYGKDKKLGKAFMGKVYSKEIIQVANR